MVPEAARKYVYYEEDGISLLHGDCLEILPLLNNDSIDMLCTDPPYSSGGFTRSDRTKDTQSKYLGNSDKTFVNFTGDSRSQRGMEFWCTLWLALAFQKLRNEGYCLTFTDWRQLPLICDTHEAGGFILRGIIAWNKGRGARAPHKGYFRHQCEYISWSTKGVLKPIEHDGPFDGCYDIRVNVAEKQHQTEKPLALLKELVRPVPTGGIILDPFLGSGTTAVAAKEKGHKPNGIEIERQFLDIAIQRLAQGVLV